MGRYIKLYLLVSYQDMFVIVIKIKKRFLV